MSGETVWPDLRAECERLDPGSEFVTPVSDRQFEVAATYGDRIVVRYRDSGEERSLWREQFEVVADRLAEERIALDGLPPGVEPYGVLLSLLPEYVVDGDALVRSPGEQRGETPFLRPPVETRTRAERVRDDATLLAGLLAGADDPSSLETDRLVDLYVLLSDVQHGADRFRRTVREPLLERLGTGQDLHARFGTVRRTTRRRRRPRDDETVLAALDRHGIPREWVLGVDPDKLDVVVAVTGLDESDVYDVDEQVYVQKTGVEEGEKYERLQGLVDRLDRLEGDDGERLRADIDDLERRLDDLLSAA